MLASLRPLRGQRPQENDIPTPEKTPETLEKKPKHCAGSKSRPALFLRRNPYTIAAIGGDHYPPSPPSAKRQRPRSEATPPADGGARRSGRAHGAARAGGRAAQRSRPHSKRRGKARGGAAQRLRPKGAGPGSEPPAPRVKPPHKGRSEASPTGGRGAGAGRRRRGEGGEPTRERAPDTADATGASTTAGQGAGRSARRRQRAAKRKKLRTGLIIRSRSKASGFAGNGATDERSETERPRQPASRAAAQQDAAGIAQRDGPRRRGAPARQRRGRDAERQAQSRPVRTSGERAERQFVPGAETDAAAWRRASARGPLDGRPERSRGARPSLVLCLSERFSARG